MTALQRLIATSLAALLACLVNGWWTSLFLFAVTPLCVMGLHRLWVRGTEPIRSGRRLALWIQAIATIGGASSLATMVVVGAVILAGQFREHVFDGFVTGHPSDEFLGTYVLATLVAVVAHLRWRRHFRPNVCVRCGYDLTGNVTGVCSECGRQLEE